MDPMPVGCVLNSISRYLHLVSCRTIKFIPIQTCVGNIALVLKLLRPLLDDIVDCKLPSDECFNRECEELDVAVNEARELLENWSLKMSKFCSVYRCEILLARIQTCSLEICRILLQLAQSSPITASVTGVERCMQEIESLVKPYGLLTAHIESALKCQEDDIDPSNNHLGNLVQVLGLKPDQDFLKESIAVEKERINAEANKSKEKMDQANELVDLVSCIREYMLGTEFLEEASGVPVPPYFRCPLSMELMLDPVIVASGQTYDRTSIQKWLDSGLNVCPRTREMLTHNELIPNYTVKAMISSWLEANDIRLAGNPSQYDGQASSANNMASHDIVRTESFRFSLRSSSFTSRSSLEIGNGIEKLKINVSSSLCGESIYTRSKDLEIFARSSPEQSYTHSRCESICSAVSSVDYVPSVTNEATSLPGNHGVFSGMSPKTQSESSSNGNQDDAANTIVSSERVLVGSGTITTSHAMKLVEDLECRSNEVRTAAAAEIRHLTKTNTENRTVIGHSGAIVSLLSLLYSDKWLTQEHAVTALLNLSINDTNKVVIAEAGALEPLVHVLNTGNARAKENSAATFFSLSVLQDYRAKIGQSNAIRALVNLLGTGTFRGKKDAASALFNLSIFHDNKARIVQSGAVKYLVEMLEPNSEMVDKSVALLANLSTVGEGRLAIVKEGGVPLLVEIVDSGSHRGKENAASVLLQLCLSSPKFCTLVLQEGAIPPLVALSKSGTPRAKEKAQQLLSHFRNQRDARMKKGRS